MVHKVDGEMTADVREFRGANVPEPSRELHGAYIFVKRRSVTVHIAACMQDAPVEGGIVRGDKIHVVKKVFNRGPEIAERGF